MRKSSSAARACRSRFAGRASGVAAILLLLASPGREALQETLRLDPTLADAHFGVGVYEYYADVAPAAAKVFRWLLLLPGGDRARGLAAIDETRRNGSLLRAEADFQRYIIDIWYEH